MLRISGIVSPLNIVELHGYNYHVRLSYEGWFPLPIVPKPALQPKRVFIKLRANRYAIADTDMYHIMPGYCNVLILCIVHNKYMPRVSH